MSLYDQGIRQGTLIPCRLLSQECRSEIQSHRAIVGARRKRPLENDLYLLVLTQDCDLDNQQNKYIELIPIKEKNSFSQSITNGRNYRKLQINIEDCCWEMESIFISEIDKTLISDAEIGADLSRLSKRNRRIVIDWRTSKYRRTPLPDQFNKAFKEYLDDPAHGFEHFLENYYQEILGLYVYIEPNSTCDENPEYYKVCFTALISESDAAKQEEIERQLKDHLQNLHNRDNCLKMAQIDDSIILNEPVMVGITALQSDFTFLDAEQLRLLNLDRLCYPDEDSTTS